MKILVVNSGSSSVKYKLFDNKLKVLIEDSIERIGEKNSPYKNHIEAFESIKEELIKRVIKDIKEIKIVAHRVVHGGSTFLKPTLITQRVIKEIEKTIPLAPLHNLANLEGIRAMKNLLIHSKHIAFFDTSFHQSMPEVSYTYAIPSHLGIRRYGFHGISHQYLLKRGAKLLNKPIDKCNIITIHLGNGSSITAIKEGKSFKTSMGFTPLEGLVMGSRSGDIDAGIIFYLSNKMGMSIEEINTLLNKKSGLKALSGSNDMRDIIAQKEKNPKAKLAFELFCSRVKEYIGSYIALIGKVDAIVFSGGIGANSFEVREEICNGLEHLGIGIDLDKNRENNSLIHRLDSQIQLFAIQTNEELEMAMESLVI